MRENAAVYVGLAQAGGGGIPWEYIDMEHHFMPLGYLLTNLDLAL